MIQPFLKILLAEQIQVRWNQWILTKSGNLSCNLRSIVSIWCCWNTKKITPSPAKDNWQNQHTINGSEVLVYVSECVWLKLCVCLLFISPQSIILVYTHTCMHTLMEKNCCCGTVVWTPSRDSGWLQILPFPPSSSREKLERDPFPTLCRGIWHFWHKGKNQILKRKTHLLL